MGSTSAWVLNHARQFESAWVPQMQSDGSFPHPAPPAPLGGQPSCTSYTGMPEGAICIRVCRVARSRFEESGFDQSCLMQVVASPHFLEAIHQRT